MLRILISVTPTRAIPVMNLIEGSNINGGGGPTDSTGRSTTSFTAVTMKPTL